MSSFTVDEARGSFRLGRVFAIAGAAIRAQWLPMLLLSLLLACAPAAISNSFTTTVTVKVDLPPGVPPPKELASVPAVAAREHSADATQALFPFAIDATLVILGSMLGVALTSLTLDYGVQRPGAWRHALALCRRDTPLLVVLSIVTGLLTATGYILLIVPGAVMTAAWCLTFPVRVAERTGLIATLRRSAQLTRGHRWLIFGLFVVWAFVWTALVIPPSFFVGVDTGPSWLKPLINLLISPTLAAVTSVPIDVMIAALYLELRRVHDGVAMESLDAVFA